MASRSAEMSFRKGLNALDDNRYVESLAYFDHSTDAWFVCLAMGALVARGLVPIALPLLVVFAFVQYTLDSRALQGQQLRASWLGRWASCMDPASPIAT